MKSSIIIMISISFGSVVAAGVMRGQSELKQGHERQSLESQPNSRPESRSVIISERLRRQWQKGSSWRLHTVQYPIYSPSESQEGENAAERKPQFEFDLVVTCLGENPNRAGGPVWEFEIRPESDAPKHFQSRHALLLIDPARVEVAKRPLGPTNGITDYFEFLGGRMISVNRGYIPVDWIFDAETVNSPDATRKINSESTRVDGFKIGQYAERTFSKTDSGHTKVNLKIMEALRPNSEKMICEVEQTWNEDRGWWETLNVKRNGVNYRQSRLIDDKK